MRGLMESRVNSCKNSNTQNKAVNNSVKAKKVYKTPKVHTEDIFTELLLAPLNLSPAPCCVSSTFLVGKRLLLVKPQVRVRLGVFSFPGYLQQESTRKGDTITRFSCKIYLLCRS